MCCAMFCHTPTPQVNPATGPKTRCSCQQLPLWSAQFWKQRRPSATYCFFLQALTLYLIISCGAVATAQNEQSETTLAQATTTSSETQAPGQAQSPVQTLSPAQAFSPAQALSPAQLLSPAQTVSPAQEQPTAQEQSLAQEQPTAQEQSPAQDQSPAQEQSPVQDQTPAQAVASSQQQSTAPARSPSQAQSQAAPTSCTTPQINADRLSSIANCTVLRKVCIDQEVYVLYDPIYREGFEDLPSFQMDDLKHLHRTKLLPGQSSADSPNKAKFREHMRGYEIPFQNPTFRVPTGDEDGFDAEEVTHFSNCTIPIIIYQSWSTCLVEFAARTMTHVWRLHNEKAIDNDVTFVIANPAKGGIRSFNSFLLEPFTKHDVTTLANFSSRHPPTTPSNATAEGQHVRCFEQVAICKFDGSYPGMNEFGRHVLSYYKAGLPDVSKVWHEGAHVLRVLFEVRRVRNHRQILNLQEVLDWCNSGKFTFPPGSNFTELQCKWHVWGNDRKADLAIASQTDVLVAMHGSGETYAIYMKPQSSIIELRPYLFGTKHSFTPMMWWPFIVNQNQFNNLYWAINLEDKALYKPSSNADDEAGTYGELVKERNVILPPAALEPVLKKICTIGFDRERYWPEWENNRVVFNYNTSGAIWHSETILGAKHVKPW